MSDDLTWFTTSISGHASAIHIRPRKSRNPDEVRLLDAHQTRLFDAALSEIARDAAPNEYAQAKRAVLRAFYRLGAPPAA